MRVEVITSLPNRGVLSAESVSFVMASLTRESDREPLAKRLVSVSTTTGQDLAALRGLSSDSSRMEVLLAAAGFHGEAMAKAQPKHAKGIRNYFRKTMGDLGLPQDLQGKVMAELEAPAGNR